MLTMSLLSVAIHLLPWKLPLPRGLAVLRGAQRSSHLRARAAASWGKWKGHRVCPVRIPDQGKEGKRVLFRARFLRRQTAHVMLSVYHRSLNCQLRRGLSFCAEAWDSSGTSGLALPGSAAQGAVHRWACTHSCDTWLPAREGLCRNPASSWHLECSLGSPAPSAEMPGLVPYSCYLKANGRSWQDGGEFCFPLYSSVDRWTQPPNFRNLNRKIDWKMLIL